MLLNTFKVLFPKEIIKQLTKHKDIIAVLVTYNATSIT